MGGEWHFVCLTAGAERNLDPSSTPFFWDTARPLNQVYGYRGICQSPDLPQLNGYPTESVASKVGLPKGGEVTRPTLYEYAAQVRPRYRRARKKEKGRILDEFCETTGLHRKAAIRLLGRGRGLAPAPRKMGRPRRYVSPLTRTGMSRVSWAHTVSRNARARRTSS